MATGDIIHFVPTRRRLFTGRRFGTGMDCRGPGTTLIVADAIIILQGVSKGLPSMNDTATHSWDTWAFIFAADRRFDAVPALVHCD
jgi:hypothetical protein